MDRKKLQKLCIKDFVKDSPAQRLKSIKLPRDLSLGGTKLNKKVYKPNLNVVRNKINIENKHREIEKTKCRPQKIRDKVKPRFVQSTGVFSEGIVNDYVPSNPAVKVRLQQIEEKAKVVPQIPKHNQNIKREDFYNEIKQYHEDSSSDSDEKSSFRSIKWNDSLFRQVKNEYPCSIYKDFLENDHFKQTLNLWQLPDTFNFKKDEKSKQKSDYSLADMPEGNIGKICIKKSGKVNIFIGKLVYELESSEWESFTENLVAINIDSKGSNATVLGQLEQRYILTPDWNYLL